MTMTRREVIIKMAVMMGATVVGPRLWAVNFDRSLGSNPDLDLSSDDLALLDEIGETILPATDVPGAKAVGIGAFMAMMVRDCYSTRDQAAFKAGLAEIRKTYRARFKGEFVGGDAADRTTLLNELDQEQKLHTAQHRPTDTRIPQDNDVAPHYFRMMKELTILGYFSSEVGCTQALRFIETPGRFDGGAPYQPGEHAWF